MYLHFISFLHSEMMQTVNIFPCGWHGQMPHNQRLRGIAKTQLSCIANTMVDDDLCQGKSFLFLKFFF